MYEVEQQSVSFHANLCMSLTDRQFRVYLFKLFPLHSVLMMCSLELMSFSALFCAVRRDMSYFMNSATCTELGS